jgi:hypothetical protein
MMNLKLLQIIYFGAKMPTVPTAPNVEKYKSKLVIKLGKETTPNHLTQ